MACYQFQSFKKNDIVWVVINDKCKWIYWNLPSWSRYVSKFPPTTKQVHYLTSVRCGPSDTNDIFKIVSSTLKWSETCKGPENMWNFRINPILFACCFLLLLFVATKTLFKGNTRQLFHKIMNFLRKRLFLGSRSCGWGNQSHLAEERIRQGNEGGQRWRRNFWGSKLRTVCILGLLPSS